MPRTRMRVDHQVPITSPAMFSSSYLDIPIDTNDPRSREPLIPLASVGVAFESYYAKTDGKNPPFGRAIEGSRRNICLRKPWAKNLLLSNGYRGPSKRSCLCSTVIVQSLASKVCGTS